MIWDEPDQVQSARQTAVDPPGADRALDRRTTPIGSSSVGKNSSDRPARSASDFPADWISAGRPPAGETSTHIATRPCDELPRQHSGGHRRGAYAGGSRTTKWRSLLLLPVKWNAWRTSSTSTESHTSSAWRQFESTPAYLAQRAYMSGSSANIYLIKGADPPRHRLSRFETCTIRVGGSVRDLGADLPGPVFEDRARDIFRRHHRPQARRLRGPLRARRGPIPGSSRDLQR